MSKNRNETRKIELVETDNMARSLERITSSNCHGSWQRALYHSIAMSNVYRSRDQLVAIRQALELP